MFPNFLFSCDINLFLPNAVWDQGMEQAKRLCQSLQTSLFILSIIAFCLLSAPVLFNLFLPQSPPILPFLLMFNSQLSMIICNQLHFQLDEKIKPLSTIPAGVALQVHDHVGREQRGWSRCHSSSLGSPSVTLGGFHSRGNDVKGFSLGTETAMQ